MRKTAIVTGSSGFIGFFVSRLLLDKGWKVTGIDNLNPYYDIDLKKRRQQILVDYKNFSIINKSIELVIKNIPSNTNRIKASNSALYSLSSSFEYLETKITEPVDINIIHLK